MPIWSSESLFKGVEERFLRNFEVSPDGSFMLLTGTSGYLHLLSMKVVSCCGSCSFNFLLPFSFWICLLIFNLKSNLTFRWNKGMMHTVTAFKNELLNQLTLALENYFGVSLRIFFLLCSSLWDLWAKARVSWVFKLSLEKVVCQYCISTDGMNTVLAKGMASVWKQSSEGRKNIGLLLWE